MNNYSSWSVTAISLIALMYIAA